MSHTADLNLSFVHVFFNFYFTVFLRPIFCLFKLYSLFFLADNLSFQLLYTLFFPAGIQHNIAHFLFMFSLKEYVNTFFSVWHFFVQEDQAEGGICRKKSIHPCKHLEIVQKSFNNTQQLDCESETHSDWEKLSWYLANNISNKNRIIRVGLRVLMDVFIKLWFSSDLSCLHVSILISLPLSLSLSLHLATSHIPSCISLRSAILLLMSSDSGPPPHLFTFPYQSHLRTQMPLIISSSSPALCLCVTFLPSLSSWIYCLFGLSSRAWL